MSNLRCSIDCDGVIYSFLKQFSQTLRELYGNHLPILETREQSLEWNFYKFLPITEEQEKAAIEHIKRDPEYWLKGELLEPEVWKRFVNFINKNPGLEIYFLTTRTSVDSSATKQTAQWLYNNGITHPQVIASIPDKKKSNVINALGIKMILDDSGKNCVEIDENCSSCKVYMMDYPHNRKESYNHISRLSSLDEYIDIIKKVGNFNE